MARLRDGQVLAVYACFRRKLVFSLFKNFKKAPSQVESTFSYNYPPSQGRPILTDIVDAHFGFADVRFDRSVSEESRILSNFIRDNRGELFTLDDGTIWSEYIKDHVAHMNALEVGDEEVFKSICSHLFQTSLPHGFGQSTFAYTRLRDVPVARAHMGSIIVDKLHRLAEAFGVLPVVSPEHVTSYVRDVGNVDDIIDGIESVAGIDISPPMVAGSLFGLKTKRGILNERHFDSLYVANRLVSLGCKSVIEIGGGAGYVSYYAKKLGINSYTIVDLPTVVVTQYLILAGSLGHKSVGFYDGLIRLVPSHLVDELNWAVDCVVNVDSFPEMPESVSRHYVDLASKAKMILSANQESQMVNGEGRQMMASELFTDGFEKRARFPYWMRTGWVEEVYVPRGR